MPTVAAARTSKPSRIAWSTIMPPLDSPYKKTFAASAYGSDAMTARIFIRSAEIGAAQLISTGGALTPAVHGSDHHEPCIGQPVERDEHLSRGVLAYVAAAVVDDDRALIARSLRSVYESHYREVLAPVGQLEELESRVGAGSLVHGPESASEQQDSASVGERGPARRSAKEGNATGSVPRIDCAETFCPLTSDQSPTPVSSARTATQRE